MLTTFFDEPPATPSAERPKSGEKPVRMRTETYSGRRGGLLETVRRILRSF